MLSVPVAFAVMVVVSIGDRRGRRAADPELLALHAPEGLGLGDDEPAPVTRLSGQSARGDHAR